MAEVKTQKDLDFERKHEKDLRRIRDFRLMDDNFMSKVFENKPCAEFLLRIILNRDDLKVKEVHGQHDLNNIQGRSVRLDILAVDHENRATMSRFNAVTAEQLQRGQDITAACWMPISPERAMRMTH